MRVASPRFIGLLAAIGFTVVAAALGTIASVDYDLSWHTIDGGGGTSSNATYQLTGSFGQPDTGPALSGGGFEVVGGFWLAPTTVHGSNCPADIAPTGGNHLVNVDDLLLVLNQWGSGHGTADISPPGGNGVVNVDDLLVVIAAWGTCP